MRYCGVPYLSSLASLALVALLPLAAKQVAPGPVAAQVPPCRLELTWAPDLKLRIGDFRAKPGDDEHQAEANTGIRTRSHAGASADSFVVEATSFFDPCNSFFRRSQLDARTLAHEQLHFDITELYARELILRYREEVKSHADFLANHERIYNEVWEASRRTQNEYDREVYADRGQQARWTAWVGEQLIATAAVADKKLSISMQ